MYTFYIESSISFYVMLSQQPFKFKTRSEAISLMNDYARNNEAFFFAVDFDAANCILQRMDKELNPAFYLILMA